jgi:hypothetical protein
MSFIRILKGVVIGLVGGVLMLLGIVMMGLPTLLVDFYGFPNLDGLFLPIGVVFFVFGLALLIYTQQRLGIR